MSWPLAPHAIITIPLHPDMKAPLPANEAQRLAKLLSYDVLDTDAESGFDYSPL